MKRAITALALVGALLLSVVACQVYNPTNNETIYTAMRTEGPISWADYSKEFEEADVEGKYGILMEYEAFRKLEGNKEFWKNKEEWVALYNSLEPVYEAAKKDLEDAEKVVADAGDDASGGQKDAVDVAKKAFEKAKESFSKIYGAVDDLKVLWDKEYDVLWDWNSKM